MLIPDEATHVALSVFKFQDDGQDEESPLGYGSFDDCKDLINIISAVVYRGDRKAKEAYVCISKLKPLCSLCDNRHLDDEDCWFES